VFDHNHHHQGPFQSARGAMNLVAFIVQSGAVTAEVFLHSRFGERYIGGQAAAALVLIPCFGMLFPQHDIRPLFYFLGSFLVMCFLQRMDIMRRLRRGDREHSMYNGFPRLLRRSRGDREQSVKEMLEPVLVFVAGSLLLETNQPLGFYLLFAAFCLMSSNRLIRDADERRLADLHDALFEQRQTMERLRHLQGQWPGLR
jgi:hypothetical protein